MKLNQAKTVMMSIQSSMAKKKGDLGHVWVAAHFPKRIQKELVEETNISSSVDKILEDQLPVVTYRILGYLLLGLTRIYSKKVEYLLYDFSHALNEMKFLYEGKKKVDSNLGGMCLPESSSQISKLAVVDANSSESYNRKTSSTFLEALRAQFTSLNLPENYELDAVYMEPLDDDSIDDHVRPHLELVLNDAPETHRTLRHTFGKDHASASTSAMVTYIDPETSVEKFRHRFCLEDRLDPFVASDSDEEFVSNSVPLIEQQPEWDNHTDSFEMISEGVKNQDKHPNEECTTSRQTVVSDMTPVDSIVLKPSPNTSELSVTIEVTPQSKAPVLLGKRKSEFVAVPTPASRENVRAPRKRKCVYDHHLVVPNEMYATWVSSASDLVRKRRTSTAVLDQKEHRSVYCFSQPIIPINAAFPSDLRSVFSAKELAVVEEVEETVDSAISKNDKLEPFNLHKFSEEAEAGVIAPLTPATQSKSFRFSEISKVNQTGPTSSCETPLMPATQSTSFRLSETHETSKVNQMGPISSSESRENTQFPIGDVDLDDIQREEGPSSLVEDNRENVPAAEKWSAVTKRVAGYLHSNFEHRKGDEEAVKLSQILKQKTKKESAKFFYQMLVLKTGGCIDVQQETPYGDICVKQTPKLKEVFAGGIQQ